MASGRRVSEATRRRCLARAAEVGARQAAREFGYHSQTIFAWRRATEAVEQADQPQPEESAE